MGTIGAQPWGEDEDKCWWLGPDKEPLTWAKPSCPPLLPSPTRVEHPLPGPVSAADSIPSPPPIMPRCSGRPAGWCFTYLGCRVVEQGREGAVQKRDIICNRKGGRVPRGGGSHQCTVQSPAW